jgi:hypothetical protein
MFPKQEIDGFEKYWRRRKPGSSTALHYASDVSIFFNRINWKTPESITVHDMDGSSNGCRVWVGHLRRSGGG